MRNTKIIKICSFSLCTCLHHMVILRTRNKITDFLMILAWASPFNISYNSLFGRQIESHLLGIGGEVEAVEHINEYFNIGCVFSLNGLLD